MSYLLLLAVIIAAFWYLFLRKKSNTSNSVTTHTTTETSSKHTLSYTWGEFDIVGYPYLPDDSKEAIRTHLKVGNPLHLKADPENTHDKQAVKVLFNEKHIGWVPNDFYRKKELYEALLAGKEIEVKCLRNQRNNAKGVNYISAKFKMNKI